MTPRRAATWLEITAVLLLSAIALAIRLWSLNAFELWVDEAATWYFSGLTRGGQFWELTRFEPTPPLYYTLIGLWTELFGDSELVLRLPSVVFGTLGIPATYCLGKALFGRRSAFVAATLLTVHPLHVFYSREARVYPLLLLLVVLSFWTLFKATQRGSRGWWIGSGLLLLAACYSHLYALFLLPSVCLMIVVLEWPLSGKRRQLVPAALLVIGVLVLWLPYLVPALQRIGQSGAAWSVAYFYQTSPDEVTLGRSLELLLFGARYHGHLRQLSWVRLPEALHLATIGVQLLLFGAACHKAVKTQRLDRLGVLLCGWPLLLFLPWLASHLSSPIYLSGRHDFFLLGFLCLFFGIGLDHLWWSPGRSRGTRRWCRFAALSSVVVLLLVTLLSHWGLHTVPRVDGDRNTGRWLAEHAQTGDLAVATGIRRLITEYYTRRNGSTLPFESFPSDTDNHPGWSDPRALLEDEESLDREAHLRVQAWSQSLEAQSTLWLLLRNYDPNGQLSSMQWRVDRHLLESLAEAGWHSLAPTDDQMSTGIAGYRPP